jgi:hypothetical protein
MAGLDDILKVLPIDQIASRLGVDPDTARKAVQQGGGAILSGLQKNAATPSGASAIEAALSKHTDLSDHVDLDRIDTSDGGKILRHVFGGREQDVAQALTDEPRTANIDFGALLPMLAPVIMGLIAKKTPTASASTAGTAPTPATSSDAPGPGGIGDVLGGLIGGGANRSGGGFDLGGLIGGLLSGPR